AVERVHPCKRPADSCPRHTHKHTHTYTNKHIYTCTHTHTHQHIYTCNTQTSSTTGLFYTFAHILHYAKFTFLWSNNTINTFHCEDVKSHNINNYIMFARHDLPKNGF